MSNRSHAASAPMAAAAALLALGALFGLWPKAGAASPRPQVQAGLRVALAAGEQRVIISVAEAGERLDEAAIAQRQGRLLSVLGAGFRLDQR